MSHTRSKIILIVFIMVISLKEYETAKGGSDSESGGWDSYSESSTYDKYSSRHLSRMRGRSSFNDLAESSSGRPRSFSAEEPISIEDIPKTCNGWIMFGLYQHKSIWRVGYWNYTAKYGDMRSDDFCNKFGDNVPTTKYLTTEESTKPCYGWIDFVGYHLEDSGVEKNKIIAELRNKKKLDLFISDWPFKYSLFLLDPSNHISSNSDVPESSHYKSRLFSDDFSNDEIKLKKYGEARKKKVIDKSNSIDNPKGCNGWIMFSKYRHESIWRVALWKYQNHYGSITSIDFCNKFGDNVYKSQFITTMESTMTCQGWIHFVGYYSEASHVKKNLNFALERDKKHLDLFVSDWPFKYGKYLLTLNPNNLLTPSEYCSSVLKEDDDQLPPISEDHELLIQIHLS